MVSSIQQCPSCSSVVQFSHDETTLLQCRCGTVIHRKEGGVLLAKPYYIITQPDAFIGPGTTGKWNGQSFTVLGRFRAWCEESVFNYWTIVFVDGSLGYLGEGYGLYSILRKTTVDYLLTSGSLSGFRVGEQKELVKGQSFLLESKESVKKWEIEGEVWMPDAHDSFPVYEFAAAGGRQIALFQFLPNFIVPYDVVYTLFAALQLTGTRDMALPGKTFTCTKCNQSIVVTTFPYAQSCACHNCGTRYSLKGGAFKASGTTNKLDTGPDMTLGGRGAIKGIEYELIGYTLKEENTRYHSQWKEYVLYNPKEGYAFLSEYEGHWIYAREKGEAPVLPKGHVRSFVYNDEPFQLFNSYSYSIVNARGEFPYDLFDYEGTDVKEFISPPEMWIREYSKKEGIEWFLGEHIPASEVKSAYTFPAGLPYKTGIGAVEPRFFISPPKLAIVTGVAILFLALLHVFIGFTKKEQELFRDNYFFPDSSNTVSRVTRPFHLDKWRSNLQLTIHAPVENSWFELEATLVNAKTGTEYSVNKGVEFYKGYSDGEYWTEGSTREDAFLTQIPEGDYYLQIQGIRDGTSYNRLSNFELDVSYDVTNDRNLWFAILFLIVWPVVQYIRTNNIEKKRWYNSAFSPFSYDD